MTTVTPQDFAGQYSFYDDGWYGTLHLTYDGGRDLSGTYHSSRFDKDFRVTATVDERLSHQIVIAIHDYNWMPKQMFTGYLFTHSKSAITGWTEWEGSPFGFYARKTGALTQNYYRSGDVEPQDFAGQYSFYDDGWYGTLHLTYDGGRDLSGTYHSSRFDKDFRVTATVDERLSHQIVIAIHDYNRMPKQMFTGYLFTRPKSAITGWTEWEGSPFGFYMTKFG